MKNIFWGIVIAASSLAFAFFVLWGGYMLHLYDKKNLEEKASKNPMYGRAIVIEIENEGPRLYYASIDGCEYLILWGNNIIHKQNCTNSVHRQ